MNIYFSRVPAAAVKDFFDGKRYANIPHAMRDGAVIEDYENPRMMLFTDASFVKGGEAYVQFAKRGDALPVPGCLPFGVTVLNTYAVEMFALADRMHASADAGAVNSDALRATADNLQQLTANLAQGE